MQEEQDARLWDGGSEMIQGFWYPILMGRDLKAGKAHSLRRLGQDLALWRDGAGKAQASKAACPHRGADLGLGRVIRGELECPYHGFRFGSDGRCTAIPCEGKDGKIPKTMGLQKLPLREEHGILWMWYGPQKEELPEIPWFSILPEADHVSTESSMSWDIRFSRVMEGMLDIHHFPFAHRKYSPSSWTRLDPFEVTREEGGKIIASGRLRADGPREETKGGASFEMVVAFPGVLGLGFGKGSIGLVLCCPIDEDRTWIGARFVQGFLRWPVLGRLLSKLLLWLDATFIQPDDEAMLLSTRPRSGSLRVNHLVHADKAIGAWYHLRKQAQDALASASSPTDTSPLASSPSETSLPPEEKKEMQE